MDETLEIFMGLSVLFVRAGDFANSMFAIRQCTALTSSKARSTPVECIVRILNSFRKKFLGPGKPVNREEDPETWTFPHSRKAESAHSRSEQ